MEPLLGRLEQEHGNGAVGDELEPPGALVAASSWGGDEDEEGRPVSGAALEKPPESSGDR